MRNLLVSIPSVLVSDHKFKTNSNKYVKRADLLTGRPESQANIILLVSKLVSFLIINKIVYKKSPK